MLYGVYGIPGSGKSYIVFQDFILKRINSGGVVVSNIKLKDGVTLDNYVYLEKRDMDNLNANFERILLNEEQSHDEKKILIEHLMHLYGKGDITLIVDEAHLYGYRGASRSNSWADDLISIHRHSLGENQFDIVLVTQVTSRLNKEINGQVEIAYLAVPTELRVVKSMLEYQVFSGVDALNKNNKDLRLKRIITKGKPEIFALYESGFNIQGTGSFRKKVYVLVAGVACTLIYVAYSFTNLLANEKITPDPIKKSFKSLDGNNTNATDANVSVTLKKDLWYKVVCRSMPLEFDYSNVKGLLYTVKKAKSNNVCYRVYDVI